MLKITENRTSKKQINWTDANPIKYRPVTDERTLIQLKQYGSKQCRQLGEEDMITWTGKGFTVCNSVSQTFFFMVESLKIIFYFPRKPYLWKRWKPENKRQLVARGGYSSFNSCRTKIPAIFQGLFGIFRSI